MSERDVDATRVYEEHLAEVHQPAHWAFLALVLIGGAAVMLGFIAVLGVTTT